MLGHLDIYGISHCEHEVTCVRNFDDSDKTKEN
jgi:predicted Zn-dependent protease